MAPDGSHRCGAFIVHRTILVRPVTFGYLQTLTISFTVRVFGNMSPPSPMDDIAYCAKADSVLSTKRTHGPANRPILPHSYYIGLCNLSRSDPWPFGLSVLTHAVLRIVQAASEEQMSGIHARAIVAVVEHTEAVRRAPGVLIGIAVSETSHTADADLSVAFQSQTAQP